MASGRSPGRVAGGSESGLDPPPYCACGRPLHYADHRVRKMVDEVVSRLGQDIPVQFGGRQWLAQRHFVALHGLKSRDLPRTGFPEITGGSLRLSFLNRPGRVVIDLRRPRLEHQIFSHREDDGLARHFHIPTLKKLLKEARCPLMAISADPDHAECLLRQGVIDQAYLVRMPDQTLAEPGIMCAFADETRLLVDGNHRFVKLARSGMDHMEVWMVPEATWSRALVRTPTDWGLS